MLYLIVPFLAVVGIIWMLVVFPSFRKVAVIVVVLGVSAYFVLSEQAAQNQKQVEVKKAQEDQQARIKFEADQKAYCQAEQKRWAIVPPSQIELRNPSLTENQYANDDFTFTASAKNKSKSKVTALRLHITALDCPTQDARTPDCDIVGQTDKTFETEVPAGEVRQINGKITMRDVPKPRGVFLPRAAINAVHASIDQADESDDDLLNRWVYGYKCN